MQTLPDEPKTVNRVAPFNFVALRKDRPQPGLPIIFFSGHEWHKGHFEERLGFYSSADCTGVFNECYWFYAGGENEN